MSPRSAAGGPVQAALSRVRGLVRAGLLLLSLSAPAWSAPAWSAPAGPEPPPGQAPRLVAVVLDTSTSMREAVNDRPRLAIQATKILADLLGPADDLILAWMPDKPACDLGPDPRRLLSRRAEGPGAFKQALDERATYGGPTNFIVPLRTLQETLESAASKRRLLIVISDAGRDTCRAESSRVLQALRAAGVHTAAVSLGTQQRPAHADYDTRTAARNPSELLGAIGAIYQRFLGAKAPGSGPLNPGASRLSATVAPFVGEAFLLVAAEGPVGRIIPAPGNPGAEGLDPDFGAGETRGLDGLTRGYRILRLRRPNAGTWGFTVEGLTAEAGWYLIQDFSISLRVGLPAPVTQGEPTLLTLELIDDRTGARVPRPGQVPGLAVLAGIEGRDYALRDDGQEGDQSADDGIMSARVRFMRAGATAFAVRLTSPFIQLEQREQAEVVPAAWGLEVLTPPRALVGEQVLLAARFKGPSGTGALPPPAEVSAQLDGGRTLTLRDQGRDGDQAAGDGLYSRGWTPERIGEVLIDYGAATDGGPVSARAALAVGGTVAFGAPAPLDLGRLGPGELGEARLGLGFIQAQGPLQLRLTSDFDHPGADMEIDLGQGFQALPAGAAGLAFTPAGRPDLPVRVRVGPCPGGVMPEQAGSLAIETQDHRGQTLRALIPIRVEIVPAPWLRCWWPVIAAVLLALLVLFILYGILSPARFPRTLAVVLSPESDLDEGYPFRIRSQKGAGSGFYRDARIHITGDFQLRRSPGGALARLRADRLGVFIQPLAGHGVLYQDADNRWEPLNPAQETRVRFSTLYRNGTGTLFFEFRTG